MYIWHNTSPMVAQLWSSVLNVLCFFFFNPKNGKTPLTFLDKTFCGLHRTLSKTKLHIDKNIISTCKPSYRHTVIGK